MPTDPAGNYTLPPIYLALAGTTILAGQHNAPLEDIAQAMSQRLMRDGRNGMVGDFNLGSFRGINAAPGTSPTDLATVGQGIPIGGLLDFAGASAPDGWLLCAGQAVSRSTYAALFAVLGTAYGSGNGSTTFNVPDLRGRVVAGLDNMGGTNANRLTTMSSTTRGQAGGAADHVLTVVQLPAHNHGGSTGSDGSHTHTGSANSAGNHTHSLSGSTSNAGLHSHGLAVNPFSSTGGSPRAMWGNGSISFYQDTLSDGAHTHTISGTAQSDGAHTHTLAINSAGNHSHAISSQGSDSAHENTQPTMVMNKIIRATY